MSPCVIGIALVALGIWLLAGREITVLQPLARGATMGADGAAGLDVRLRDRLRDRVAVMHGRPVPRSDRRRPSRRLGVAAACAVYVAYAAGFALVVGVLAVAAALASSALVERMRRIVPYVNRISGALLVVVGLYVGYYGLYEVRLFTGNGNPADPVVAAAGRVQGAHRRLGAPARRVAVAGGTGGAPAPRSRVDMAR